MILKEIQAAGKKNPVNWNKIKEPMENPWASLSTSGNASKFTQPLILSHRKGMQS